jgi:hypothetical protein
MMAKLAEERDRKGQKTFPEFFKVSSKEPQLTNTINAANRQSPNSWKIPTQTQKCLPFIILSFPLLSFALYL